MHHKGMGSVEEGDADFGLDALESDDLIPTVGMGLDSDGTRSGPATTAGTMKRRHIREDRGFDVELSGYCFPDWE